jgi:nucleoside-triphosphatase
MHVTHVLLTGRVQVGKSTALNRFIKSHGLSADGYRTYWRDPDTLFIGPYGSTSPGRAAAITANYKRIPLIETFDSYGTGLVRRSGKKQLIVFDELGRLEIMSVAFTDAILEKFDGDKPILGVIKPEHNRFLDAIRAKPNVATIEVTLENRDNLDFEIRKYLDF